MKDYFNQLYATVKEVIIAPGKFWERRKEEGSESSRPFSNYFLPLLAIVFFAVFASELMRGSRFYITYPLMRAFREVLLFLLQYVISAFLTNELIKPFGGKKNIAIVRQLVIYSLTPFMLVSLITGVFPFLYVIDILGLYGFFIFWAGIKVFLEFPERKLPSFFLVAVLANFFVFSFLSIFLSKLMAAFL
ncbi:Yip1 domain-containing protein [Mariniphaga anaerophila]|uniref:Yip1 domain-containing protein n=1 Tax=Mariniphaga anaerophila TaxID=1484053 RepID=A0A1M5F4R5_9BACT|nr:Yip1 family protein [Mariniphaga anaerophila]SHF86456.1 Yip1 domain-containing protein [Mariniphaga anaerophila]